MPDLPLRRGDLTVITPRPDQTDATPAVCLVLDPDVRLGDRRLLRVALTHSSPELATDLDLVLPPGRCGVAWPVVVQGDLLAVTDPDRAGSMLGHVDEGVLETCNRLLTTPALGEADGVQVGWRLRGPTDRRWGWKADEGRRLDTVAAVGLDW